MRGNPCKLHEAHICARYLIWNKPVKGLIESQYCFHTLYTKADPCIEIVSPIRPDGCATVDVNLDNLAVQEKDSWWGVFFNVTATVIEEGTNIRQSKWKASDVTQMHYDIEFINPTKTFKTVGWKRTKWPDKQYLARNIYEGVLVSK